MSSSTKKVGPLMATGSEVGEASAVTINLDFKPSAIRVVNVTTETTYWWTNTMSDGYAWQSANSGGGTAAAQTFTGTASTAAEISAFTGTGQSSSGQVITTTDNQTMTLDQCAGMWFISATHGPYFIVSNTAVTGAPAVLTVIGDAPTTDAGAYRIVKSPTPVGTNGTSAVTATASNAQLLTSNGITAGNAGFILGTSVQTTSDVLHWVAFR